MANRQRRGRRTQTGADERSGSGPSEGTTTRIRWPDLTDADQEAARALPTLQSSASSDRQAAMRTLRELAARGSAIANFHLGEWYYDGPDEADKKDGLRHLVAATRAGYLAGLVAAQRHEDPLCLTYDFLARPEGLGLPRSLTALANASPCLKLSLLASGLEQGVWGYAPHVAKRLFEERGAASRLSKTDLGRHVLSVGYGLLREYFDRVRAREGPGSVTALEENDALGRGFSSWGDFKARGYIASFAPPESLGSDLAHYADQDSARKLPHGPGPIDGANGAALFALVSKLGSARGLMAGCGIDPLRGLLHFLVSVLLGYGWGRAGDLASDLAGSYETLGGSTGIESYLTRVFGQFMSVEYATPWRSDEAAAERNYFGVMSSGGKARDVIKLDLTTSRIEQVYEKHGTSNISVMGGSNIDGTYQITTRTIGTFMLSSHLNQACLVIRNERKAKERTYTSRKNQGPEETKSNVEQLTDFPSKEYLAIDRLTRMERCHGTSERPAHFQPGDASPFRPEETDAIVGRWRASFFGHEPLAVFPTPLLDVNALRRFLPSLFKGEER